MHRDMDQHAIKARKFLKRCSRVLVAGGVETDCTTIAGRRVGGGTGFLHEETERKEAAEAAASSLQVC